MKKIIHISLILTLGVMLGLIIAVPSAGENVYVMTGKIAAIDPEFETAVIEVPLGDKSFTVGGPLVSEAKLKKGGRSAALLDFSIGEQVTVKWRSTAKGHMIEMIESR
jgi:hypothetical protein